MRTPGHDFELAAGFLLTEGIIEEAAQIASIRHCTDLGRQEALENVVRVELSPDCPVDLPGLQRHFYTSSSCGVCGKTSIEAVRTAHSQCLPAGQPVFAAALISELPDRLREAQTVFAHTGGLHAAALYDTDGRLLLLREDVGRHNALDKLIGACLFGGMIPLHQSLVLVSGRTSFELVQKAWIAGVPLLAAVGAPSSLAAQLAGEAGMTLLGFVRDGRFNVYTGMERIQVS
jgi:FdhD protein